MKQRVNIQYSIGLEELPLESQRILNKAVRKLNDCASGLQELDSNLNKDSDNMLTSTTVDSVSSLREELAGVDFMLHDLTKIVGGYVSYKMGESIGEEEEEPAEPEPDTHESDLKQKIAEQMSKLAPNSGGMPPEIFDHFNNAEQIKNKLAEFKKES
jgi:hypothetical protein|tara:strand:- start:1894 stop:2364 length:471 start_codon:yes stop_codon:yes gene_type:complete